MKKVLILQFDGMHFYKISSETLAKYECIRKTKLSIKNEIKEYMLKYITFLDDKLLAKGFDGGLVKLQELTKIRLKCIDILREIEQNEDKVKTGR